MLGSRPRRVAESSVEVQEGHGKEGFRRAFVRNVKAVVARRTGERVRKPTQFFDEARTPNAAEDGGIQGKREKKIGDNKRYASINVRTLAMKGDKNRKEACGQTAAAVEWTMELEARGLGIVGLQECRIPSAVDGHEGNYRTFYSGKADVGRQHGVGIYLHSSVTRGEFDVQPVNERIVWVFGSIYGIDHAVYAPTNKKDNGPEVDKIYSALEQQVMAVRTKYGPDTKIIILGDFNARVGTDGADNITEECNEAGEECANGTFGFAETDDNGAELLTFCVTRQFKVMDSYFERRDGEYGTWACNHSRDKWCHAALVDHILVSKALWGAVVGCGVHIPSVRWNTDHRMVELDLGRCGEGMNGVAAESHQREEKNWGKPRNERLGGTSTNTCCGAD